MGAQTHSPTPPPSLAAGPPLDSEPGLGPLTLPGFLREVTSLYGEREALVMRTGDGAVRWTYTDLWERSLDVARALRACGLGKDGRVGVLMTNRAEWLAAVFGASLAGGVAVTLSTFSTPAELDHLLQVSGVSVLLFERTVAKRDFATVLTDLEPVIGEAAPGPLRSARYPLLRHLATVGDPAPGIEGWDAFLGRGDAEPRELLEATAEAVLPSDTAVLFFSSGSTSRPKGIVSAHRGVTVQMWRFRRMYGVGPDDEVRTWTANGFFWSGNFGMAIGTTLAAGGSLVLQSTFDPGEALELMQAERVSMPIAWPHQWAQLESAPGYAGADLSTLRFVDFGTPLAKHPTVSSKWFEPGHAYGNTETFTITTGYPANTPEEVHAGSSGVPFPGNTVKVVDPLSGEVVPRGEAGEICVKGPTLMLGYLGTPLDETLDAEGFFHTGDGGRLDGEGRLFWTGRLTDIIKTGGANVSPREVDEALAAHPAVKVTHTVGVPHETLGEVVVGCVVPHEGAARDADGLRAYLRESLASYKVPRHVLFFAEDELPLTGSSKIKTDDLRKLAAERLDG
ncbi:class I adenylate-forming enzyme family protein [Actinomadura sp. WMMB 499]|uniref:class I adenylate-forming enzyme family protein n=1 Tax=Actinomadura sp. WMMB 499 TaxID=1219491 RepID=UPI001247C31E|nr:AMP-binding protein [Actinomadura sp. WMMB 499]QFG26136.1 AMP-binding protein [Actinomadura sp. WMMB 499]